MLLATAARVPLAVSPAPRQSAGVPGSAVSVWSAQGQREPASGRTPPPARWRVVGVAPGLAQHQAAFYRRERGGRESVDLGCGLQLAAALHRVQAVAQALLPPLEGGLQCVPGLLVGLGQVAD